MAISTTVFITTISALLVLLCNVGPAASRPSASRPDLCPECTAQDIVNCPVVVANATCTVVKMEGCSCCSTGCARRLGENCFDGGAPCEESLVCLPERILKGDFAFDPDDVSLLLENWVCMTEPKLPPLDGNYEYYGDENYYDGQDSEEVATQQQQNDESEFAQDQNTHTDEDNAIVPDLMPVYSHSDTPPSPPFSNHRKACQRHADAAMARAQGQGHADRHQWFPICHHLGRKYKPEQCTTASPSESGQCWCVDRHGNAITGFFEKKLFSPARCEQELQRAK